MEALIPLLFVGGMWLLLVRPQQQRVRRQRELVANLVVGDRVVTIGGIVGTIVWLSDDEAHLEVAPGTVLTLLRAAVSRTLEAPGLRGDEGDES